MNIRRVIMAVLIIITTGIIFGSFVVSGVAAPNLQINYQGKLTNTSDVAVADGSYNLRFKLCTGATCAAGGDPIWTETFCKSSATSCDGLGTDERVTVTNGLFSAMLGSITSLSSIDFNQTLYLEVNVGGSGTTPSWETLTPRKILGTVPASFEAVKLGGATWAAPGAIGGTTAAAGTFSTFGWKAGTANVVTLTHSASTTRTITFPDATDTVVLLTQSQALTSKTYNGLTLTSAADGFTIAGGTISRTLTVTGADKSLQGTGTTISLGGTLTTANALTTAGNYALTITATGTTNATVPAGTVTLVDLASSQALTNKTISGLTVSTTTGTLTIPAATIAFSGAYATTLTTTGTTTVTLPTSGTLAILGANTFTSNQTIQKADPSLILDVTTATDTDFWVGVQDDAGSDDDDTFQIGDGTTPGTNPFLTIKTDGSVGIGTTGLSQKLDVVATAADSMVYPVGFHNLSTGTSAGTAIKFGVSEDGTNVSHWAYVGAIKEGTWVDGWDRGTQLVFGTFQQGVGLAERMRITGSGNVGIGTTAPDAALEINHATGDSLRLTYNDSNGSAANYTDFSISSTGALTITGSAVSVASASGAEKTFLTLTPATITLTGTTQVTSLMDTYLLSRATIAGDTATVTVDDAATLTIDGPPSEGSNVSLTEAYGLKINTAATTATTAYGLYVDAPTGAGSNYGAIFASGNVGIGTTNPLTGFVLNTGSLLTQTSHDAITSATVWNNLGSASEGLFLSYDATNNRARIVAIETATAYRDLTIAAANIYLNSGTGSQTTAITISSAQAVTFSGGGGTATAANPTVVLSSGEKTIDVGGNGQQLIGGNSAGQLFMARNVWWDAVNNVWRASRNDIGASILIIGTDKQLYFQNAANATSVGDIVSPTTRFQVTDTDLTINTGQVTLSVDTNFVLSGGINGASFDTDVLSIDATNDRVGVGTAAPAQKLHVSGGSGDNYIQITTGASNPGDEAGILGRSSAGGLLFNIVGDASSGLFSILTNSTSRIAIDWTTGGVGLGDTSPTEAKLVVGSAGAGDIYATFATANTAGLCWDNSGASLITDCSSAPGDIAEWYDVKRDVEDGDIVIVSPEYREYDREGVDYNLQIQQLGKQKLSVLQKSQGSYTSTVVGVVSDGPWQIFGEDVKKVAENPKPVALAGRVPIKVTSENGAIAVGDLLVSSSTPGYAMRYNPDNAPKGSGVFAVIGTALESFNGERGKVMAMIKSGYVSKDRTLTVIEKDNAVIEVNEKVSRMENRVQSLEAKFVLLEQKGVTYLGGIDESGAFQSLKIIGDADVGGTIIIGKAVAQKYSCVDCEGLFPGAFVYITKNKEVKAASSLQEETAPAIGVILSTDSSNVTVAIGGTVDMFKNINPGTRYYLAQEKGKITSQPTGVVRQVLGIAQSATELLVMPSLEYRVEKLQQKQEPVVSF